MVKLAGAEVLLDASFAVQETVVVPSGNVAPETWSHETVGDGSTASVAVTVNGTLAPPGPVASAVMFAGTESVGGVASTSVTVTVKVAVPVLIPSLAEHVTVVVPTAKFEPDEGEQLGIIEPATASVADAAP
jgi:hypothetical protein